LAADQGEHGQHTVIQVFVWLLGSDHPQATFWRKQVHAIAPLMRRNQGDASKWEKILGRFKEAQKQKEQQEKDSTRDLGRYDR
jgi:hypothetical protein